MQIGWRLMEKPSFFMKGKHSGTDILKEWPIPTIQKMREQCSTSSTISSLSTTSPNQWRKTPHFKSRSILSTWWTICSKKWKRRRKQNIIRQNWILSRIDPIIPDYRRSSLFLLLTKRPMQDLREWTGLTFKRSKARQGWWTPLQAKKWKQERRNFRQSDCITLIMFFRRLLMIKLL